MLYLARSIYASVRQTNNRLDARRVTRSTLVTMPIYSYSRLGSFETCPRKYWYSYIEKPDIERVDGVEAFLGSRAHDSLEELHRRRMGGQIMGKDELLAWYEQSWEKNWHDNVRVVDKTLTAEDYRQVGRNSLQLYYDRYHPFDQDQTLKLEARVLISLDDEDKYRLQGYIDRLTQRPDGTYEIHDYKTSKSVPTQEQADADTQLALYQIGVEGMWDDVKQVDLVWHYVRFDKEIRSRRTPEQLDALRQSRIAVIDDIESRGKDEANFPTSPSRLCDWCDFRELCPATRHAVAVKALPPKEFKDDNGVELVDQLSELRWQRGELNAQLRTLGEEEDEIRQRIIAFAQASDLETVIGSSHQAGIAAVQKFDYPRSADDRRPEFEKVLCDAGIWDQVSSPNGKKLEALWENREDLPKAVQKALAEYVSFCEEVKFSFKKRQVDED